MCGLYLCSPSPSQHISCFSLDNCRLTSWLCSAFKLIFTTVYKVFIDTISWILDSSCSSNVLLFSPFLMCSTRFKSSKMILDPVSFGNLSDNLLNVLGQCYLLHYLWLVRSVLYIQTLNWRCSPNFFFIVNWKIEWKNA